MKIALIGAPGAGKSTLATLLADQFGQDEVGRVDDYIRDIEEEANIALGPIADYLGNLTVALGRWARERRAGAHNSVVITCGTLIENAVYMAMHFEALGSVLTDEEQIEMAPRIDATLRMFAALYLDVLDYDYAFYLPLLENASTDSIFVDTQLQAGLAGFKVMEITTLGTDTDERVAKVLEVVGCKA